MENKSKVLNLVVTGLLAGIIFIMTYINIRLPISAVDGGLIHLGGVGLIIAAYLLPPVNAGFSGAIGMGMFDIMGGYGIWAPFTFIIRFVQGFILSKLLENKGKGYRAMALVLSIIVEMIGYYIAEGIIYGNWVTPLMSMPGEIILNVISIAIGVPIAKILIKNKISYKNMNYENK